jgi:hypothetical protein
MIKVTEVIPLDKYCLDLTFTDGTRGTISLCDDLTGPLSPLLDPDVWSQVHIRHGVVTWSDEIDLAPEFLFDRISAAKLEEKPDKENTLVKSRDYQYQGTGRNFTVNVSDLQDMLDKKYTHVRFKDDIPNGFDVTVTCVSLLSYISTLEPIAGSSEHYFFVPTRWIRSAGL